jgi:hypothetical protein
MFKIKLKTGRLDKERRNVSCLANRKFLVNEVKNDPNYVDIRIDTVVQK